MAQGGANTGMYNINEPLRQALRLGADAPRRGVLMQVDAVLARAFRLDALALYVVWAGSHDFGNHLEDGQADVVTYSPVANIRQALEKLARARAQNFVIGNMTDQGSAPAYYSTEKGKLASRNVAAHDCGIVGTATELCRTRGLESRQCDAVSTFIEIAMNRQHVGMKVVDEAFLPMDYVGFRNLLAPAQPWPGDRQGENPNEYMIFCGVGASSVVHTVIGDRAAAAIAAGAVS